MRMFPGLELLDLPTAPPFAPLLVRKSSLSIFEPRKVELPFVRNAVGDGRNDSGCTTSTST